MPSKYPPSVGRLAARSASKRSHLTNGGVSGSPSGRRLRWICCSAPGPPPSATLHLLVLQSQRSLEHRRTRSSIGPPITLVSFEPDLRFPYHETALSRWL